MTARPQVIAFDVIETLFSLEPLRRHFTDAGLPQGALETWFAAALRDMFALAASESYAPMKRLLEASLDELCAKQHCNLDKGALIKAMGQLPPHPDVTPGIRALKDAGYRMIAVSNGAKSTTKQLLEGAGLGSAVEKLISTDDVERAKPDPKVYLNAARVAEVEPEDLMLIASHPWDIHGARSAGLKAASLDRAKPFPDVMKAPDLTGQSLTDLAEQLAKLESSGFIRGTVGELTS